VSVWSPCGVFDEEAGALELLSLGCGEPKRLKPVVLGREADSDREEWSAGSWEASGVEGIDRVVSGSRKAV
jgi:hypothetical protein